jgi:hypothetical protein
MVWFRVDDTFYGHPKATGLSNDSLATWTRAGNWSGWQLTDGAVPREMLAQFAKDAADPDAVARDLVNRRLWETAEEGWQFHDWADYNPTREQVLAKRKADAERRRRWLQSRRDAAGRAAEDHTVSHGVTGDHAVSNVVTHAVTDPDPPPPDGRGRGGEGNQGSDRNAPAPETDDDDEELTQVQALMAAAGRPVNREEAATIRTTVLAKGGQVRNQRAYIGRVLGDPKQARAFAPGAGHVTTVAEIVAEARRPHGPTDDPEARAAEARQQLATRERPPRPAADPAPAAAPPAGLHGEALATAQLAAARANRLPELPPAPATDDEDQADDADVPY